MHVSDRMLNRKCKFKYAQNKESSYITRAFFVVNEIPMALVESISDIGEEMGTLVEYEAKDLLYLGDGKVP